MANKDEAVCRGSIYLGSQCGSCPKCKAEIKKVVDREGEIINLATTAKVTANFDKGKKVVKLAMAILNLFNP